jgi:hypothetical protein
MSIITSSDCEVCSMTWFLQMKNTHPAKIHCQLEVYGEGVMKERNVSVVFFNLAEGQMSTMKRSLGAHLSSPNI